MRYVLRLFRSHEVGQDGLWTLTVIYAHFAGIAATKRGSALTLLVRCGLQGSRYM